MARRSGGTIDDRVFVLDASVVIAISAAIVLAADRLALMSALVPLVLVLRLLGFAMLARGERGAASRGGKLGVELAWFGVCIVIGGFNDWNSVHHHRIYDYGVPVYFPEASQIPIWMLLFWGMILRFFWSLARWHRLADEPSDLVALGPWRWRHPGLRVGLQLALVMATRQAIYRLYDDPLLSWLPFAAAIALYAWLFRPSRERRRLFLLALLVGPLVEVAYIQLGGLHRYHLGVLGGVPLWIALWWPLAVLVWVDVGGRAHGWLQRSLGSTGATWRAAAGSGS